jgi:cell division protein FtsN
MAKDFAHKGGGGRQTGGKRGLPGWVWLIVGIAIGFIGAVGWYIAKPRADAVIAEATGGKIAPAGKKKITIPPKEPSRFAFYELLPKYEVLIPKESLKTPAARPGAAPGNGTGAQPAPAEPAQAGRYMIQVGAFKDKKEAEQQRANLALLGVESRIETVTIDNATTWYRVRIGPEKDQHKVESILSRLEENNVQATVMMVPD